jgi:hypothetical protein
MPHQSIAQVDHTQVDPARLIDFRKVPGVGTIDFGACCHRDPGHRLPESA